MKNTLVNDDILATSQKGGVMTKNAAIPNNVSGLTFEQYTEASEKAKDIRRRLESGEDLGIDIQPVLDQMIDYYGSLACTKSS